MKRIEDRIAEVVLDGLELASKDFPVGSNPGAPAKDKRIHVDMIRFLQFPLHSRKDGVLVVAVGLDKKNADLSYLLHDRRSGENYWTIPGQSFGFTESEEALDTILEEILLPQNDDFLTDIGRICYETEILRPLAKKDKRRLVPIQDFLDYVRRGLYSEDDGWGYLVKDEKYLDGPGCYAMPFVWAVKEAMEKGFTHVCWYGK